MTEDNVVKKQLENYMYRGDQKEDLELAKTFFVDNYPVATQDVTFKILKLGVVAHFKLDDRSVSSLRIFLKEQHKQQKEAIGKQPRDATLEENDTEENDAVDIDEQDPIQSQLRRYKRFDSSVKNFEVARQFIEENYKDEPKSIAHRVIASYVKNYFSLGRDDVAFLKMFWVDLQKAQKASEKAAVNKESASEKEAKMREENDKKKEEERARVENEKIREKRLNHLNDLYDILRNKNGKHDIDAIEVAKTRIKELMMDDFWKVEGYNQKTGNNGHLSLQKLAIADYISKAFNIVKFGGRLWWYDWRKAFYTYDSDDAFIHSEVATIMNLVGDKPEYIYNGNSLSDKSQIIDMASLRNPERVFIENPFNKHTGYINAKNGVLKLDYVNKRVTLLGKKPDYMFSYCIDTTYNPDAKDTAIHEMLRENLGEEQRDFIYQMAAIAIRDTDPHLIPSKIAYLFIGPRNTGKNVVMQVLNDFFGNAIVSRIPLIEIAENKFVKPLLEGKVINLDDELPEHLPLTESREIKSLTGGKFHTLEPKNVKPYSGIITALLVFAGNQFPKCSISKNDSAFWDRWEIINFAKKQHDVNENYLAELLTPENLSGFFNRVIKKLFEIHDHKITRKQNLGSTYDEWLHSSSTVYRFFQEMTVVSDERMEYKKDEFYKYYLEWCDFVGIPRDDRAATLPEFGRELIHTCKVKEGRIGTDERHYVYRMHKRYEVALYSEALNLTQEVKYPEHVSPVVDDLEPPEEIYTEDDYGNIVREFIYNY